MERVKVEFRGELYNALNHTNFTTPNGAIAASGSSLTGGTITSTFDPRIVQFGAKVLF
jgi:hypothetical protein